MLTFGFVLLGLCCYALPEKAGATCNDWKPETWIAFTGVVISLLSSLFVVWGVYVAVEQLKISAKSTKFSAFCRMNEVLRKEAARERRGRIYKLFDDATCQLKVPFEEWTQENRKDVHDALAEIDRVGQIIKYGFLDYDSMGGWDHAIYKTLRIAEPLRKEEEAKYSFEDPENPGKRKSHYYPGIQELIRLRKHRTLFDFEERCE